MNEDIFELSDEIREPTRQEIDSVIQLLINKIIDGKILSTEEFYEVEQVLSKRPMSFVKFIYGRPPREMYSPALMLLRAMDKRIISNTKQLSFISEYRAQIMIENQLTILSHSMQPLRRVIFQFYLKPLPQRREIIEQIPGIKQKIKYMMDWGLEHDKLLIAIDEETNPKKKAMLQRRFEKLQKRIKTLFASFRSEISGQVSLKFSKPMPIVALRRALDDSNLSSREKTIIARHIERLEGKSGKRFQLDNVSFPKKKKRSVRRV